MNNEQTNTTNIPVIPDHQIIAEATEKEFLIDSSLMLMLMGMCQISFMILQIIMVLLMPNELTIMSTICIFAIPFGLVMLLQKHVTIVLPRTVLIYDGEATTAKPATKTFKLDLVKILGRNKQYYK